MLHPHGFSGYTPSPDDDLPHDDDNDDLDNLYSDVVWDDDPDGKTIDGWQKHDKPWVVCSPMDDGQNTLVKWFDTKEEAKAWKAQMEIERPARYNIAHRSQLYSE